MTLPIKVSLGTAVTPPLVQYWRQPHDVELRAGGVTADIDRIYMGDGNHSGTARGMTINATPEVYRVLPGQQTPLSPEWIRLWKDLNPDLSVEVFCGLLDNGLAWTNNTGWPGRRNCLTGDLMDDPTAKDPAFHEPLINGGALLRGTFEAGNLLIDSLLTSWTIVPPASWVFERPWYWSWGVNVNSEGVVTWIQRTGMDGRKHNVRIPFITRLPVYLPLTWLDPMPGGFNPATYDQRQYG